MKATNGTRSFVNSFVNRKARNGWSFIAVINKTLILVATVNSRMVERVIKKNHVHYLFSEKRKKRTNVLPAGTKKKRKRKIQ